MNAKPLSEESSDREILNKAKDKIRREAKAMALKMAALRQKKFRPSSK